MHRTLTRLSHSPAAHRISGRAALTRPKAAACPGWRPISRRAAGIRRRPA